jgi:hypothetical protein
MINNRKPATLALATLAAMATSAAMIPQEWAVEVSRVKQYQFQATHGDTMELKATFWHDGEPFDVGGDTFHLCWQTNGMDRFYWSAPATASSNTVSAVFENTMDPGAPIVYGFLGATSGNYRASFAIRFAPGPGAVPNALPLPAPVIDFATVEVLNAPYYTKAETEQKIIELSPAPDLSAYATKEGLAVAASSATNYTDSTASTLRDDIAAAATLTPIYSNTPTFSAWVCSPEGTSISWHSDDNRWVFSYFGDGFDSTATDRLAVEAVSAPGITPILTATRTRTDIIGYTLGNQSDKPLQPKGDYALKSELPSVPVTSVNGQTGAVALTADDVGAVPTTGGRMTGNLHIGPQNDDSKRYRLYIHGLSPSGYWRVVDIESYGFGATDENDNRYQIYFPSRAGTLALLSDIPSVAGRTFDFATTQGVMDALKTVIETLGGTVTNAPSAAISQGE